MRRLAHNSVAVVMSTYNGQDYLEEQIESVLAQRDVEATLFVRDDGSSDNTRAILERYKKAGALHLSCGENIGVTASFLEALAAVPRDYAYVALSDQDDVWLPDHLARALEVLDDCDAAIPQLYCSEYWFCDTQATPQERSHLNKRGVSFATMLYENVASGNTMVLNRALMDELCETGCVGVYCHDWWIALVACALGQLHYDEQPALYYRRTGENASATGTGAFRVLRHRIDAFVRDDQLKYVIEQLRRIETLYSARLVARDGALLQRMLFGSRFAKATVPVRLRQTIPAEFAVRLLFLLGKL